MHSPSIRSSLLVAAALLLPAAAQTAVTFSLDSASAGTFARPSCAGVPIHAADLLVADTLSGLPEQFPPLPPCIAIRHTGGAGSLGLPSMPLAELDAHSFGTDTKVENAMRPASFHFSVDRGSRGLPMSASYEPNVRSEWSVGDSAASVFCDAGLPPLATALQLTQGKHVEVVDGNGRFSGSQHTAPGIGLAEPALDDLDSLDAGPIGGVVYFSLDGFVSDPCYAQGGNGTAPQLGQSSAAIFAVNLAGGAPIVWASAAQLGLDRFGANTDDLDALAIANTGNPGYDAVDTVLGWNSGSGDMVLFSVRRGSAVVGQLDCVRGLPIEPGDILQPPIPGGLSLYPGIVVPAEALGLVTLRAGTSTFSCGVGSAGDDLDALDVLGQPLFDCDQNGTEDALDIATGALPDVNHNGVPDGCDVYPPPASYCTAGTSASGCTPWMDSLGTPSASSATSFTLRCHQLEGAKSALCFYGVNGAIASPWSLTSNSFICVRPPVQRMTTQSSGGVAGACDGALAQDWNAYLASNPGALGAPFAAGAEVHAQSWYRDPPSPKTTSLSSALKFTLTP